LIGETLGPYRIEKELGSGGMGSVYLAESVEPAHGIEAGTHVALKVVHPHLLEQPNFLERFEREAQMGRAVEHENLVRTFGVDTQVHDGKPRHFLVMELVEGQTLRALQKELRKVPEELCRHVACELARALAAIHAAGIVHRDLKPENALITHDERVKIMALAVTPPMDEMIRLSQTGAFVGSVLYAAPEQFRGGDDLDGRADLYALGLTLYELATGRHPFADDDLRVAMRRQLQEEARPLAELNPQVSPFFEEVVHTLLAKDRGRRFGTADELLAVLEQGEESEWWRERAREIRAETKQPLRRVRIPRETALYGRDADLAKLRAAYDRAKGGRGQVLLIDGEAGIGKTRLVDEFVGLLRQEGEDLHFLFGSYPPGGAATAAGAFSTAFREQFGDEGLEDTLRGYLAATPVLVPAFAALLRGDSTPKGEEPLTKDSIQTVYVRVTRALAAERPTVLLIDDLGFAPAEGRALFSALSLGIQEHRVLLVATSRPGLPDDWVANLEREEHGARMELARLGPKDLSRLLVDAFRSERLAHELSFEVGAKSDGNPFFVFEIIRGLREGEFITQSDDGSWERTQVIRDIQIPSSVLDLIQARIGELDESEKDLLEVASCLGYEFDPALVAEATGMGVLPVLKQFARIERRHRLIRAAGRRFLFDHHQVQESLYEGLFEQIREHYHKALGDALEARAGVADADPKTIDGSVALALCRHYLSARDAKARRYVDRALIQLSHAFLHEDAVALADRALAAPGLLEGKPRLEVLLKRLDRLGSLGRRDDQRAAVEECLTIAEVSGSDALAARARYASGLLAYSVGDVETAFRDLSASLDLARSTGDAVCERGALNGLALCQMASGRFEEARAHFERSMALGREHGDEHHEAMAAGNLALVLWDMGRTREASALLTREIELAATLRPRALVNLAELWRRLGREDRARPLLEEALPHARETGNRSIEASVLVQLGGLAERSGELDLAAERYAAAIDLGRGVGNRTEVADTLVAFAGLRLTQSRPEDARALLEEGLALARDLRYRNAEALACAYLSLLPEGDASEAEALCAAHEEEVGRFERIELRLVLWKATGRVEHLAEAQRQLTFLRDHAPQDCRESILENVPLHAAVVAAWAERRDGDAA
jgi:tetratricopeptide (TPR) repeat protein